MPKVKLICEICGAKYEKYPSLIGKHHFCSRTCYLKAHASKNEKEYICEICGKIFKSNNSKNANRFCSRACYNKFHNIKNKERVCPVCGIIFIAKASDDKYCSTKCFLEELHRTHKKENHPNWKGGITEDRDTDDYKKWRQAVYKRDNYKCVKCGSRDKINAHHIRAWKYYPELRYEISNGETLCEKCHIKLHQLYGYDTDLPIF